MDRMQIQVILREIIQDETSEDFAHLEESSELTEELGLDSVDFVSVVLRIEDRFLVKLETKELQTVKRVSDLLNLIQAKLPGDTKSAA